MNALVEQVRTAHARWMLSPRSSRQRFTWYHGAGDGFTLLQFVGDDALQLDIAYLSGAIAYGKGPFTGLRIDLSALVGDSISTLKLGEVVVDGMLHAYDNAWSAQVPEVSSTGVQSPDR